MATLYDILVSVARKIGDVREGISTDGSTTTLIDTTLGESNDYYNGGTLFINQGTPAAVGITDWNSSTGTFTFPAIGTAVTVGTHYMAIGPRFPLDVLKYAVNLALEDTRIMLIDETLVIVADQERYTLPAGVRDIRRVEIGNENETWNIHRAWKVENNELRFLNNAPSDTAQTIRLHYVGHHEYMENLSDLLDERVDFSVLRDRACLEALMWRYQKTGRDEPLAGEMLNYHSQNSKPLVFGLIPRDTILARY